MKFTLLLSTILIGSITFTHGADAETLSVTQLVAGEMNTCALFSNKRVKCWGSGTYGQTGAEHNQLIGDDPADMGDQLPYVNLGKDVLVDNLIGGDYTTCAVTTQGKLKCWGYGGSGGLASGKNADIGSRSGEMGDLLPYANLGTTEKIKSGDGGYLGSCVIFTNGKMKCWGYNSYGQLGLGDMLTRGDTPETVGEKLLYVDLGNQAMPVKVSVGRYHTCAIFNNGKLKCWGYGGNGTLGYGDTKTRGDEPNEMGDNLPFIDLGKDQFVIDVTTGESSTCALLKGGRVKCWGFGGNGTLGYGDTKTRGDEPNEMGDNLPFVDLIDGLPATSIQTEINATCATFLNGTVKCWGVNFSGQLGLGDGNARGDEAGEMGDALDFVYLGRNAHVDHMVVGGYHACAAISSQAVFKGVKCWGYNSSAQLGLGHYQSLGATAGDMTTLEFLNLGTK